MIKFINYYKNQRQNKQNSLSIKILNNEINE